MYYILRLNFYCVIIAYRKRLQLVSERQNVAVLILVTMFHMGSFLCIVQVIILCTLKDHLQRIYMLLIYIASLLELLY